MRKLTTIQSRERFRNNMVLGARWTLILGTISISAYGILLLGNTSIQSRLFKMDKIEYAGVEYLDTASLNQMITRTFPDNVLKIRLERLRSLVESENWVKTATVRRRLPNRIQIHVSERTPQAIAAVDNELVVVDEEGVILAPHGPRFEFLDRPIVKGLQNTALENARKRNVAKMKTYLELIRQLDAEGRNYVKTLSEIDVSNLERVTVVPADDPVPIVLGNQKFLERYQVFLDQIDLYHEVLETTEVESIDVTFEDRIIIRTSRGGKPSGAES